MAICLRGLRRVPFSVRPTFRTRPPPVRRIRWYSADAEDAAAKQTHAVRFATVGPRRDVWLERAKTVAFWAMFYYSFKLVLTLVVVEKVEKVKPETRKEGSEETDAIGIPEVTQDDALFVSLSYPKKIKRRGLDALYKSDDPDWKNIDEFCKDPKAQEQLRTNAKSQAMSSLVRDKRLLRYLGDNIQCTLEWIDMSPHRLLPIEYERFGMEVTDEDLYTVTRPMTENQYLHVKNTLWPETLAYACYDFGKTLYYIEKSRMKRGYASLQRSKRTEQKASLASEALQSPFGIASPRSSDADDSKDISGQRADSKTPSPSPTPTPSIYTPLHLLGVSARALFSPGSDLSRASMAFRRRLAHGFSKMDQGMERGEFFLEGWLQVQGTKGEAKITFIAYANAKTRQCRVMMGNIKFIRPNKPSG